MKLAVRLHKRVCDLDLHGIYDLRAQLDTPPIMSRLDTILNPQDDVTPTIRSEYVYYNSLRRFFATFIVVQGRARSPTSIKLLIAHIKRW
jgi:hypothetical protein